MMGIPQKKLATIIVGGALGKLKKGGTSVEDQGGKKTAMSYVDNEKPESDAQAAKRDAAQRMLTAFKADDAKGLADAMTDFNALCAYGDEDEEEGAGESAKEGGSKVSDANRTVKQGLGY